MIKAGALFYAVIVSIVMAIISGSLILSGFLFNIEFQNDQIDQRLSLNATSGINILLTQGTQLQQAQTLDLYGNHEDSVLLKRMPWGVFEVVISKAFSKNKQSLKIAQTGYYHNKDESYCLYLSDQEKPLGLCGNTKLVGVAYLPAAGAKKTFIEGKNYSRKELVYGKIKRSEKAIPNFNSIILANIKNIFTTEIDAQSDSSLNTDSNLSNDSVSNSFSNNTLIIRSTGIIKLAHGIYSGNIFIISDKQIEIASEVTLKDVIIAAPKVFVRENFRGNAQIFATDSIVVEKGVALLYPSVLGLVTNSKSCNQATIFLNQDDTIIGTVFANKSEEPTIKQTLISLPEKCLVMGQVYTNGYIDVKGSIYGSLMCSKILLHTTSSVYENNLLNALIDRTKLSGYFVEADILEESAPKKVIKWLN